VDTPLILPEDYHTLMYRGASLGLASASVFKGANTSKIKHAIKHKTSPARRAQLLQLSLAFCFSLQPMAAYRPENKMLMRAATVVQQPCKSCRTCFIACFILLVIAP